MQAIPQLNAFELSNYITPSSSHNERLLKPRISMIDSWYISGVLFRTDIAEVALADNLSTDEPVMVSYLLPSVLPGTSEYDLFIESGTKLRDLKKLQFHEELRVKNFGKKLSGLRYIPKLNSGIYVCSHCETPIPNWPSENECFRCTDCANEIRYVNCDIWLPAITAQYHNHISLKSAFDTLQREQLRIPNGIFCHLLYRTASQMMLVSGKRIAILLSSDTVIITGSGKVEIIPAPTGRGPRVQVSSSDVPTVIADYFRHFLSFVPDPSEQLMAFLALPNRNTIQNLKLQARSVSSEQVIAWLRYLRPSLFAPGVSRKDAYVAVQEMLVSHAEQTQLTPRPRSIPSGQLVNAVIQQRKSNTSILSELASRFQAMKFVAAGAFALFCAACIFAFSEVRSQPALQETISPVVKARAVESTLHSTPARVIRDSIPAALKEKHDNSMATVRLLVSENGIVKQVQWIYATDEQRRLYDVALSQLNFEPASNSGNPVTGWTTMQLPLR